MVWLASPRLPRHARLRHDMAVMRYRANAVTPQKDCGHRLRI
jgi:hypothetical protein